MTTTTYTSRRTTTIRAADIQVGDRILDPRGRLGILKVYGVEDLQTSIWVDAVARRSVLRRLAPNEEVQLCVPKVSDHTR